MAHRDLDELVVNTEHARPLHPFRALLQNHCYLDGFVEKGGMSLLLMDGLILIPVIMFAFFYPMQVLVTVASLMLLAVVVYEGCVIWKRRHPARN